MTPAQARRAAALLDLNSPRDPEGLAAAMAAVDFLRRFASQPARATWSVRDGFLLAGDPGRTALPFPRVPAIAANVPAILARPGEPVPLAYDDRHIASEQRRRLVTRLLYRRQSVLAEAINAIRLEQRGERVYAIYAPTGMPLLV